MALFQIFRGAETELNSINCHEGYAYFCEDTGNFFIDVASTTGSRVQVNAHYANALKTSSGTEIDIDKILLDTMTIAVKNGGTGRNNLTVNALLIGDGENPVKMVSINEGNVVVGDNVDGVKGIQGVGVLYSLTAGAPQFGTLPISLGGTGGTSESEARQNLDVYSKTEVDTRIENATTVADAITIMSDAWTSQDGKFIYNYTNTNLKCGKNGDVPPIITYTSNLEEYSKIESAVATAGKGVVFTIPTQPKEAIGIIIVDVR